jgi:benzoylformate decarboxylase
MGLASAIGVQIANPNRMVVSVSGDGGGMYTIQSLWSAARHKLPIKYIVCNNGVYNLLKLNILQYWKSLDMEPGDIPLSFDLSSPMLRFDDLARAMSVPSIAVTKSQEIPAAVAKALAEPGPFLIDLRIQHEVHEKLIGVKCGQ